MGIDPLEVLLGMLLLCSFLLYAIIGMLSLAVRLVVLTSRGGAWVVRRYQRRQTRHAHTEGTPCSNTFLP